MANVGYTPFFVCLGVLDLVGAAVLWRSSRERGEASRSQCMALDDPQSDPAGLQSRPVDRARRRRLLHRDVDLRVVPGVQIHHSRDLVHWRLLTRPLDRASQLNMLGDPDSCGIWAPCLTYADGLFWLIYTDVKRYGRTTQGGAAGASLRDIHNYLVTVRASTAPWSEPVYLNSSGFDPSLFHDDDGRKYLVNMLWDHRPGQNRFAGIVLQEYSVAEKKLIGERRNYLHRARRSASPKAPHLYKRGRLLLPADGGRRDRMGARGDDGAVARLARARTSCIRTATS